jgi:hypothetical protein
MGDAADVARPPLANETALEEPINMKRLLNGRTRGDSVLKGI